MYESTTYHLIQKIELMKNKIIALSCTAALLLFVSEDEYDSFSLWDNRSFYLSWKSDRC